MSGDYLSIVLLDSFKQLKNENKFLKDTINRLQTMARVENNTPIIRLNLIIFDLPK